MPQKISPNASSNSVASLKASERATTSGKTPTSRIPSTGDAKSRADVKKSIPSSVKPGAPTSKPESVSTSLPPSISSDSATTTASAKSSVPPPSQAPAPPALTEEASTRTSDPLQVAAQVYPWLYMTSTLEACFRTAEEKAMNDLEERSKQLQEEESGITDQRIRFEAEQAADFYDELATDYFAKEAPFIMQTFLSHGDACTRVEAEALELATHGARGSDEDAPLQVYNDMLDSLEELHAEAVELESSILRFTSASPCSPEASDTVSSNPTVPETANVARSQILGVFSACLPVVRARMSNLAMAQDLIDGAQENLSISLRMESLGILD